MRLVAELWKTPKRCAAVPHIDPVSTPTARFIDTGSVLPGWDQHVYLSDVAVRQAMSILEYPTPLEFEAMQQRAIEAEDALLVCNDKLIAAEEQLAAADVITAYVTGQAA